MKTRTLLSLLPAIVVLTWGSPCFSAEPGDPKAELKDLVTRVQAKLGEGKGSETELASELKEFDALLERHKEQKTDDVAQILLMKAMLYLEVFKDADTSVQLMAKLKKDFPETSPGKGADQIINSIKAQKEALELQKQLVVGKKFPDFNEKDQAGKPLSIKRFKGKVVLVDFWATWCGPCVQELPNVIETYRKYHGKGFDVIGISLDKKEKALTDFVAKREMAWPQYYDGQGWGNKLAVRYGVQSIPATYLLDKEGVIVAKDLRGPALGEAVAKALDASSN